MRLERSDRYIMKCPVLRSRLGQESVRCGPKFIQVSRPLPLPSDQGQTPWLLSLRGELVASLEDASLMGLYVDINATTVTIQSPRQDLLQRWEVLNTTAELLPLWLLSGHHAYSLEAACPPVSSQPESEVLVHIPKQRLGLVKRGSYIEETLSLQFLQVHQSNTFMVTENKDFVVVSIPAARVLQVQQCRKIGGTLGTQAFYRVDLSLEFAEMAAPVLWTVESFFQCVGSGTELPASTAAPRTTPSPPPPGPETSPVGVPSATASQVRGAGPAAQEWLSREFPHQPSDEPAKKGLGPFLQTAKPARSQTSVSVFPRVMQAQRDPQTPPGEAGLPGHPTPLATLPSEPVEGVQAGRQQPHAVSSTYLALALPMSSDASSPPPRAPRPGQSKSLLVSGPSVTLTEGLGTVRPEQDPTRPPGSPLLLRGLAWGHVAAPEPALGEPDRAREEFQPLTRPWRARLAALVLVPHHSPGELRETSSRTEVEGLRQTRPGLPREGPREHLDPSSSEPSQNTEGLGLPILPGTEATFSTSRVKQPDPSACVDTSEPALTGTPRVRLAVPLAVLPMEPLPAEPIHPAALLTPKASSAGGPDQARDLESAPSWPVGQEELGFAHTSSPLSRRTLSLWAPTETSPPSLVEHGHPYQAGQGAPPQQELMEPTLAPRAESHRPPELQDSVEGLSERPPC
ncbi:uncharacterized protein C1orf127 homolog [Sapajus apella]|uniref:Uncharacterized protein C1orf127 homolog n=1 Tax=Sapajus apella TaxID=9515 RepID=A0A6J3JPZ7_SAPAP|nr:uncharacterized protein C1orf127 homolog [Sapajus apella]